MASTLFPGQRVPSVTYSWLEWLQDNGIVTFFGAILPAKTLTYEELNTSRTGEASMNANNDWTAQTFTIGATGTDEDFYVTKIWVDGKTLPSQMVLEIQETTAGKPNGTIVTKFPSTPTRVSDSGANPEWYEYTIKTGKAVILSSGTKYAIVVYRDEVNTIGVGFSTAGYTGGAKFDSVNGGSTWTEHSGKDMLFRILGTTKTPYILTTKSITSAVTPATYPLTNDATQFTLGTTFTFEADINKSAIIQGDAIVIASTGGGNSDAVYTNIELYHVNAAGAETKIGEAQSLTNVAKVIMALTRQKISPGEKIRLKFAIYYVKSPVTSATVATVACSGTDLVLHLPFKTDL